jgi:glycerol uptake facilitator-like aquaporin
MFSRRKIAMIVGEFLGTAVLTLVVLSVAKSSIGIPYFVALAAGLTVAGMTMTLGAVTGAHLNPAITIAFWTARKVKTSRAIVYVAAQLLGGAAAYLLYTYFVGQHWQNSGHYEAKLLVAEAVGAMVFGFAFAAAIYQRVENSKAAATVGAGLALGIIIASSASAGFLNPAVALGARSWGWGTYVLGPVLGAVIGVNLYNLLFATNRQLEVGEVPAPAKVNATSKKKK